MLGIIAVLLVIWLVCAIIGFVVKGLLWLAVLGLVAFAVTGVVGAAKHRRASRGPGGSPLHSRPRRGGGARRR